MRVGEGRPAQPGRVVIPRTGQAPATRTGLWGWVILYASGVGLAVFLLLHIGMVHFGSSAPFTAQRSFESLRSAGIRITEMCLLGFALIHGMVGLRRVILDLEILNQNGARILTGGLAAAGLALFIWGYQIFRHLLSAGPL